MNKKILYLFLALLLPGLIFIFLKRFGKNEFDIPLYYQHSADSLNALCGTVYSKPYSLPDSVLRKIGWKRSSATLFVFDSVGIDKKAANRISETFSDAEYRIMKINPSQFSSLIYKRWTSCVFFVAPPWNVVLTDSQNRIRGYYSFGSREEVDRLIMEMKILLKKY